MCAKKKPAVVIPRTLPRCDLLCLLAEKAHDRHDLDFDFLGTLAVLRQRVSEEVRQINVLFPEYTPHDENYHLKKLFHVACLVLGRERLEAMNSAELFVLAAGLYGHDWGMAVSEDAKQYILTGQPPEGVRQEDLWVLPDERRRVTEFARKQQLPIDDQGRITDMPLELWREYVRQTHAWRDVEVRRPARPPFAHGMGQTPGPAARDVSAVPAGADRPGRRRHRRPRGLRRAGGREDSGW